MILPGSKFFSLLLEAVFPRFCVSCGNEGKLFCDTCSHVWWHESPEGADNHVAMFAYANPVVRKLICAWKYDYDLSAFELLKQEANESLSEFKEEIQKLGIQAVVPLPLSPKRLRERGFNQSRMIADWLGSELKLPVIEPLERSHRTGHQAERSPEERQTAMMNNPFLLKYSDSLPENILLVDDVWTTGATLGAAKKILESTGNNRIFAFTLAKG